MIRENGICLGEIEFESIYPEDSIFNEEGLGKIFKSGKSQVYIYPEEGFEYPHFHIIFGGGNYHKKQDRSNRAYQCCVKIFEPVYFQHEANRSDILVLTGKEGLELNKFMNQSFAKVNRYSIPDRFIYSDDELLNIQKGVMFKNKVITNWLFCKYYFLTNCDNPKRCQELFLSNYTMPDYSIL